MLSSLPPILSFSLILLTMHPGTAANRPQCLSWKAPHPQDCDYILAHLPSILPISSLPSPDSLQSTSNPFFPQAYFRHRSCMFDLGYVYYNRTKFPWTHRRDISKREMAQTWHDQKAACSAIVEQCCDGSRSGFLWEAAGDDDDRKIKVRVVVENGFRQVAHSIQLQSMAYHLTWPEGIARFPGIFHKPVYEL